MAQGSNMSLRKKKPPPKIQLTKIPGSTKAPRVPTVYEEVYVLGGMTVGQEAVYRGETRVTRRKLCRVRAIRKENVIFRRGSTVIASWDIPRRPDGLSVSIGTLGIVTEIRHPWDPKTGQTELVFAVHFDGKEAPMWMGFDDISGWVHHRPTYTT